MCFSNYITGRPTEERKKTGTTTNTSHIRHPHIYEPEIQKKNSTNDRLIGKLEILSASTARDHMLMPEEVKEKSHKVVLSLCMNCKCPFSLWQLRFHVMVPANTHTPHTPTQATTSSYSNYVQAIGSLWALQQWVGIISLFYHPLILSYTLETRAVVG